MKLYQNSNSKNNNISPSIQNYPRERGIAGYT